VVRTAESVDQLKEEPCRRAQNRLATRSSPSARRRSRAVRGAPRRDRRTCREACIRGQAPGWPARPARGHDRGCDASRQAFRPARMHRGNQAAGPDADAPDNMPAGRASTATSPGKESRRRTKDAGACGTGSSVWNSLAKQGVLAQTELLPRSSTSIHLSVATRSAATGFYNGRTCATRAFRVAATATEAH
jgi:hypothetical protein